MGEYYRSISVGLLGIWPPDTKAGFSKGLRRFRDFFSLKASVRAAASSVLSEGFDRKMEATLAHELCLARSCDVCVYVNDGAWSPVKREFVKRLAESTVLIIWTPHGVKDDIPSEEEGVIPGIMQVKGRMHVLTAAVAYLGSADRQGGPDIDQPPKPGEEFNDPDEEPSADEGWGPD